MTFTPTPEQSAIVDFVTSSSQNLLISALAGAAKTSTLVLIAEALPNTQITAISFNKRIAEEMKKRLPPNCESMTLNSLGFRTWTANLGQRAKVDSGKIYRLVKEAIEHQDEDLQKYLWDRFTILMSVLEEGKTRGWLPDDYRPPIRGNALPTPLLDDEEFFSTTEEELLPAEQLLISELMRRSCDEALGLAGPMVLDFSDQLFMPTLWPVSWSSPPVVLIDEAQDLSPLNHVMLKKFARRRLIAVGDECQSIYGFRGADQHSMANLETTFAMERMTLTVSFRCPIAIVEAALWRAPTMKWGPNAKPGSIATLASWDASTIPDDGVILCRNNAPLFSTAIKLLRNGRHPELVGSDIGKTLVKWLRKLGPEKMTQAEALAALADWTAKKLEKSRVPAKVHDQAACLEVFIRQGRTLSDAIAYAEKVLSLGGPVKLMTVHKSKGLEFDDVYLLDEDLIDRDAPQERNLRYVAITRSKSTLTYIYSEGFINGDD